MEITYRNRARDFLWFLTYSASRYKSSFLIIIVLLAIIIGPQVCVWLTEGMPLSGALYIAQHVFYLTFVFAAFVLAVLGASMLFSAIVGTRADFHVRASPDGLWCKSWRDERQVDWARIKAVGQSEQYIWIFISNWLGYLIPKRAFGVETDAAKFYDYCHEHWRLATQAPAGTAPGAPSSEFPPRKKGSRLGILSLVLAIVLMIPMAIVSAADAMAGGLDETLGLLVGALTLFGMVCSIVAVVLGVIALFQKNTSKGYPIVGILINLSLLLLVGSIVLSSR